MKSRVSSGSRVALALGNIQDYFMDSLEESVFFLQYKAFAELHCLNLANKQVIGPLLSLSKLPRPCISPGPELCESYVSGFLEGAKRPGLWHLCLNSQGQTELARISSSRWGYLALSPDKKFLAGYVKKGTQVSLVLLDTAGDGARILKQGIQVRKYTDPGLAWSPDSRRLAFIHEAEIHCAVIRSGRCYRLTAALMEGARSSLRGPGGKVAYITKDALGTRSVAKMNLGATLVDRMEACGQPQWDPDGLEIGYVRDGQLNLVHSRTGARRVLRRVSVLDKAFAWSSDGQWLAYSKEREY